MTVNCTDPFWNVNPNANPLVSLRSNDTYDIEPATASLTAGTGVFQMTQFTANTSHLLTAIDADASPLYASNVSSTFTVTAAAPYQVHLIVPGQSFVPGKPPYDGTGGKSGTPQNQVAGTPFYITVMGTDQYYNLRNDMSGLVSISDTDLYGPAVTNKPLAGGETTFYMQLVTYSSQTIIASYSGVAPSTSSIVYVQPGAPNQLLILAPGEVAQPGNHTSRGRTVATPSGQTAGVPFNVTVDACDFYYNPTTATPNVTVTTIDPYASQPAPASLINGTTTFALDLVTLGVCSASATATSYNYDYTGNINVKSGNLARMQILLPGETGVPGKFNVQPFGKTGTVTAQTAGVSFNVTVNLVDSWWNLTSSTLIVTMTDISDPNDVNNNTSYGVSGTSITIPWYFNTANGYRQLTGQSTGLPIAYSSYVWVNAGSAIKLITLVPGETYNPGSATGKSGSPTNRIAGLPFQTTVYGCDALWNRVPGETSLVQLVTSDNYDDVATGGSQTATLDATGTSIFTNTLFTATTQTITATGLQNPVTNPYLGHPMTQYTSTQFTVVSSDAVKLQVLLPGENYDPGRPPYTSSGGGGKNSTASVQTAGVPFNVTARAVDPYWNTVSANVSQVHIYTQDPYDVEPATAPLVGGVCAFVVDMITNSTWTISAVDTAGILTTCVSSPVYVNYNIPTKLQVILPGETAVPGYANGKTGSVLQQIADDAFNVTVNLTDNYWNRVIVTTAMPSVTLGSTDLYWSTPTARTLVSGTVVFSGAYAADLVTAATQTITASGGGYVTGVSSPVCVNPNAPTQLIVIVPGETQVNGRNIVPVGRGGTPVTQQVGQSFVVTAYAVDRVFNLTPSVNDTISFVTSDPYDLDPGNILMTGGVATATCQLHTAQPTTVSGADAGLNLPENLGGPYNSSVINVIPGVAKKLQVLVPGETALPGFGKTGSPGSVYAGTSFTSTINVCDDYWNLTSTSPIINVLDNKP